MKSNQLIPASAFVVLLMGTMASVKRNSTLPGVNFWLGLAIAYLFISLIEEIDSDTGGGLAVLVMVSALLGYGEDVAGFAAERTGGKIGQPLPTVAKPARAVRPPTRTVRTTQERLT